MVKNSILIQASHLSRTLTLGNEPLHVLKDLSFEIRRGEWVSLTGPSGSGKSTLLGLLAGIDTPTSGKLAIDGVDITHMSEHQLARIRNEKIGIVFQSFNLIPTLTAQENVEIPLYIRTSAGDAQKQARLMLQQVGLGDRLKHRPHQLSGGQQQRVAIARALVTKPAVLLADEPTGNLDGATGETVIDLLFELQALHGATLCLITHDRALAARCDRTIILADGRIADDSRRSDAA